MPLKDQMLHYYKFNYYFSALHSMTGLDEDMHPHTFTVLLYIEPYNNDNMDLFSKVDSFLSEYFSRYTGKKLNYLPCFEKGIPTLEVIGNYFYEEIKEKLQGEVMNLIQLDICDNPLRVYSVSDRILFLSSNVQYSSRQLKRIIETKQKYL